MLICYINVLCIYIIYNVFNKCYMLQKKTVANFVALYYILLV